MEVIVIRERDLKTQELDVIGVADSVEKAEILIKEYYGEFKEISKKDIRESDLEYSKILEAVAFNKETYKVEIVLQWFTLNVP